MSMARGSGLRGHLSFRNHRVVNNSRRWDSLRTARRRHHLNGGHLVLGAIRRPVGVLGGNDVGAGIGMMERRVYDARLHALGKLRAQENRSLTAGDLDPVALAKSALLGI